MNGIKIFHHREALAGDTGLKRALETHSRLDIIAVAGEIAVVVHRESLLAALGREGFFCRFVIYDPSPATAIHYDALIRDTLNQDPGVKRAQAAQVFGLAEQFSQAGAVDGHPKMRVRVIRNRPLLYNLWVASDAAGVAQVGHISINSYDPVRGGPAFRASEPGTPLLLEIQNEFEHVWDHIAEGDGGH